MNINKQYHILLNKILKEGIWREDPNRKGTKRLQVPFHNMIVDLREGFPLLTTKQMWWKGILVETLGLLRGEKNIKYLIDQKIDIWNKDAYNFYIKNGGIFNMNGFLKLVNTDNNTSPYENNNYCYGDIGKIYGDVWTNWDDNVNQLTNIINSLIENPLASNHIIFGDNPSYREEQALTPCMNYMQFSCERDNTLSNTHYYLDLSINYRSHDVLLGYPWNVAQYALILHIISMLTNKTPRYLRIVSQNVHLYDNQVKAAKEQLLNSPNKYKLPKLDIQISDYNFNDLDKIINQEFSKYYLLKNYQSYPKLINQPEMISYA